MQPVSREDLEKLIEEAKSAGKDTSELEKMREKLIEPAVGEEKKKRVKEGHERVILSTGPAREEDFE